LVIKVKLKKVNQKSMALKRYHIVMRAEDNTLYVVELNPAAKLKKMLLNFPCGKNTAKIHLR
jgi:hypothetical protein